AVIWHWLGVYFGSFVETQTALFAGLVGLCFVVGRKLVRRQLLARWPVLIVCLIGMGMYVPVPLELRYVAGFIAMFWVALFSGLEMLPEQDGRRLVATVTIVVAIAMAGPTA